MAKILAASKSEFKKKQKRSKKSKSGGFESLGLSSKVYNGVKKKGYRVRTPIQRKTISFIQSGCNVVAMARTGSGKTAAFLIPRLCSKSSSTTFRRREFGHSSSAPRIKTESGAKMKANKTGIYKRWKEQLHKKVSLKRTNDGSVEGASTSAGNPGFRGDYRRGSKVEIISSPSQMLIFVQKSKKIWSSLRREGKRKWA